METHLERLSYFFDCSILCNFTSADRTDCFWYFVWSGVFKKDPADDSLEFVGEDLIDHTAKKERLSLYIGYAFDIVVDQCLDGRTIASVEFGGVALLTVRLT